MSRDCCLQSGLQPLRLHVVSLLKLHGLLLVPLLQFLHSRGIGSQVPRC
jgi:hypothetical protein